MDTNKNYYRILGVLDDAEEIVIRAAYRALAQRYHPDKWQGDSAVAAKRMAEINEAYSVLSDKDKRAEYYGRNQGRKSNRNKPENEEKFSPEKQKFTKEKEITKTRKLYDSFMASVLWTTESTWNSFGLLRKSILTFFAAYGVMLLI